MRLSLLLIFLFAMASWRPVRRWPMPYKKGLLAIAFFVLFLLTDGSASITQSWEGAPQTYWPVGLAVALLLYAGPMCLTLILVSALVAAIVNYHRHLFGWCGIPGVVGVYVWYLGASFLLRGRWRIDPKLSTFRDVRRYLLIFLPAELLTAFTGALTLLGDGYINRSQLPRATLDWWASDTIAIVTFAPFLLVYVMPQIEHWLTSTGNDFLVEHSKVKPSRSTILEWSAQFASGVVAVWIVFGLAAAIPYQPLYLLFIPLIWVSARYALPGAALGVFAINIGLTFAAWVTQAPLHSMPRFQFAMLALGLTGLCLGAVVSEGKCGEEELRRSGADLQEAQRVARLGSWTIDTATGKVTWTEELFRMFGLDPGLPVPLLPEQERIVSPESWKRLNEEFEETLRTGIPFELEVETVRPDGSTGWILARGAPRRDAYGDLVGLCGIAQDITERKRVEKQVQYLAYYDPLTKLPNRSLLQDRLATAIAGARRRNEKVAVLFFDLDRFKIINDSLGHAVGDLLLQQVAQRLKKQTREQDTVARMGGDEFVIVLSAIRNVADVSMVAERIVNAIAAEYHIQGRTLKVSCSLGVSIFPEHGESSEILLKNADAAMYGAKENGRNQFHFFTDAMNAQVIEHSTLEHELHLALAREELFLMYQPQIDIATGRLVGFEALLRWRHCQMGLVSPDKFIRVAESSGEIVPIGEWVLRTACWQARAWQQQGLPGVPIAVNVSAIQFRQEGFKDLIPRVLRETGISPQLLELELTESLLTKNADLVSNVLHNLKDMGVKLAVDDFGTGYSSLSYLRLFPLSKLKIDRSFIRDVETNSDAAAIATAVIGLAKSLHLKVIAEGVETSAQLTFLREHGCDEIQGYYSSPPLDAKEVAAFLQSSSPHVRSADTAR